MDKFRLAGKVALITGGASGIGKAVARRLRSEGAHVVISDLQSGPGMVVAAEYGAEFILQDVTSEVQWAETIEAAKRVHGDLHILVNNAGILGPRDAVNPVDTRLADWRKIFAVNVEAVFLGCRSAIPLIAASGGGSIINMSSVAGLLATPYATAYGASKAAVRQLTKSVAQHCVEHKLNIRCNSVHPGNVRTPLWDEHAMATARSRGVSFEMILSEGALGTPMGEFTQPEDVAASVAFLVSEDARHITGAELIVDGGIIHCDTYRATVSGPPGVGQ